MPDMNSYQQDNKKHVLILGATGFIGSAVATELVNRGHHVTGLARSEDSAQKLTATGINVLKGDIREPEVWLDRVEDFDAVIQTAITWSDDMAEVDEHLIRSLINVLTSCQQEKTLIYTGGCWAYGNTGSIPATENSSYDPTPEFSWMVDLAKEVGSEKNLRWMMIHPAMVYEGGAGVLDRMIDDAKSSRRIRIVGDKQTCWTMVHRQDIASLYALALEHGQTGYHYNGAGIETINLSLIASALAKKFNIPDQPEYLTVEQAIPQWGNLARGYRLSQAMSSGKAIAQLGWRPKHIDILRDIDDQI